LKQDRRIKFIEKTNISLKTRINKSFHSYINQKNLLNNKYSIINTEKKEFNLKNTKNPSNELTTPLKSISKSLNKRQLPTQKLIKNDIDSVNVNKSNNIQITLPNDQDTNFKNIEIDLFNIDSLKIYSSGDVEFEKELVDEFLKETHIQLSKMKECIDLRDFVEIKNAAHKMKSSVDMFGLFKIKMKLIEIIENSLNKSISPILQLYNEIQFSFKTIFQDLQQLLIKYGINE